MGGRRLPTLAGLPEQLGGLEPIPVSRPILGEPELQALARVLRSGRLTQGPEVAAFESQFGTWVEGRQCVAVGSGTAALQLALVALGIGPGDEVILPAFTFVATANAVRLAGATPVLADIRAGDLCLDPASVQQLVGPRTRAIVPVHLFGHPAPMPELAAVAARHDLLLVEDAAQAHGAGLHGRPAGSFADAGAFSFYPSKNITCGEGGMVVTASAGVAHRLRRLRNQGAAGQGEQVVGGNARMSDLHAAIGQVQLGRLAAWTAQRRRNAAVLDAELAGVVTPPLADGAQHAYHQYTVRVVGHDRDAFAAQLAARGIGTGVHYRTPLHRRPPYRSAQSLPVSEQAAAECLSLPVHPGLGPAALERVVRAVNAVAAAGS